jgi:hypothetical protein
VAGDGHPLKKVAFIFVDPLHLLFSWLMMHTCPSKLQGVFQGNKMNNTSVASCPNFVACFPNFEYAITAFVTKIDTGYCVTLFDEDANMYVGDRRIYPVTMLDQAVTYAKTLADI